MQSLRTGFYKPQIEKSSHTATEDPACHKGNWDPVRQKKKKKKKHPLKKAATKYDSQQKSQILKCILILFIMVLVASAVSHRDGSQ